MNHWVQDNDTGRFKRKHNIWSIENFDDGYIDKSGRFRVYCPDHPRVYKFGYVLRSILAYEYYYKTSVLEGYDIHHKDKNRLNDSKDNLELITHNEHSSYHNDLRKSKINFVCIVCGKNFTIPQWRVNEGKGKFCSLSCYHKYPISKETRLKRSASLIKAYKEGVR